MGKGGKPSLQGEDPPGENTMPLPAGRGRQEEQVFARHMWMEEDEPGEEM